ACMIDAIFELNAFPATVRFGPSGGGVAAVFRMDHCKPARSNVFRGRLAGIFFPEWRFEHAAIGGAAPFDRGGGLDQCPRACLGEAMGLFNTPAPIDVAKRSDAAQRPPASVEIDLASASNPALGAVIRPENAELGFVGAKFGRGEGAPVEFV